MSYEQQQAYVLASLASGAASADGIKQSTALANYLLNAVNCTAAPNCTTLNRNKCYKTVNTCGACVSDDFVGALGDSNSPCVSVADYFESPFAGGNQQCTQNCTNRGICGYEIISTGQPVSECLGSDFSCMPVCHCDGGFEGAYCQMTTEEFVLKQASRSQVFTSIAQLIGLEDPDEQTIGNWVNSVTEATQSSDELSGDTALGVLDSAGDIMDSAIDAGMGMSGVEALLGSVNCAAETMMFSMRRERRRLLLEQSETAQRRYLAASRALTNSVSGVEGALKKYSALVSQNMLPGQSAVQSIQSQFRLNVQVQATDSAASTEVSVYLPVSLLESLYGHQSSSVSVPVPGNDGSINTAPLAITTMSLLAQSYVDASEFNSNPLTIHMSSLPCSDDDCQIIVTLQNSQSVEVETPAPIEAFNATCAGETTSFTHTCANGRVMTLNCNGTVGLMVNRCPRIITEPSCNLILGGSAESSSGCETIAYNANSVNCSCPLSLFASDASAAGRRKLQTTEETASGDEGYSVSYVAMLSTVEKSFVSTIISAQGLNADLVARGWKVLVTIGVFAGTVLLCMFLAHHHDEQKKRNAKLSKAVLKASASSKVAPGEARRRKINPNPNAKAIIKAEKNAELSMIEQSLPQILSSSQSFTDKCVDEVKHNHRWFGVIFFYSEGFPRILRVTSLATNIIVMLFIQSVTYNLVNPDDGSCEYADTYHSCVDPRSPFATGQAKCAWTSTSPVGTPLADSTGSCEFIQPDGNMKLILFVAIFSAIVSTPIALTVDYLIKQVLSAPTKPSLNSSTVAVSPAFDESFNQQSVVPGAPVAVNRSRRGNIASINDNHGNNKTSKQSLMTLTHRELTSLSGEIRKYRETLTRTQLEEFDNLWGLDAHGCFLSGDVASDATYLTKLCAMFKKKGVNVQQAVYNDLKTVNEQFEQESEFFESKNIGAKEKRSRLLFLFQCDLLPGISGKILENKGARDFYKAKKVSLASKIASWALVLCLNAGMLFYVLLFALNQTTHRQNAWFNSFVVWLIVEILLVSTAMALLTHVLIPSIIMKDVTKIKQKLLDSIREYHINATHKKDNNEQNNSEFETDGEKSETFNAAKFLFVSQRIAKQNPNLKECQLISQFSTPWPRQSYQHVKDVSKGYSKGFSAITKSGSIILIFFITNLLNIPATFQDMVIHMATTTTIGYTMLLHIQLFDIFPLLVIAPLIIICIIAHFAIQSGKSAAKQRLAKLMPAPVEIKDSTGGLGAGTSGKSKKNVSEKSEHNGTYASRVIDLDVESGLDRSQNLSELMAVNNASKHRTRRQSVQHGINVLKHMNNNEGDDEEEEKNNANDHSPIVTRKNSYNNTHSNNSNNNNKSGMEIQVRSFSNSSSEAPSPDKYISRSGSAKSKKISPRAAAASDPDFQTYSSHMIFSTLQSRKHSLSEPMETDNNISNINNNNNSNNKLNKMNNTSHGTFDSYDLSESDDEEFANFNFDDFVGAGLSYGSDEEVDPLPDGPSLMMELDKRTREMQSLHKSVHNNNNNSNNNNSKNNRKQKKVTAAAQESKNNSGAYNSDEDYLSVSVDDDVQYQHSDSSDHEYY